MCANAVNNIIRQAEVAAAFLAKGVAARFRQQGFPVLLMQVDSMGRIFPGCISPEHIEGFACVDLCHGDWVANR